MRRRPFLIGAAAVAAAAVALTAAPATGQAEAQPSSAGAGTCIVSGTIAYSPALTSTPKPTRMRIDGDAFGCLEVAGAPGGAGAAKVTGRWNGRVSKLHGQAKGTLTFTWQLDNGRIETSTIQGTVTQAAAGAYPFLGRIKSGRNQGATVELAFVTPPTNLLGGPVAKTTFIDPGMKLFMPIFA